MSEKLGIKRFYSKIYSSPINMINVHILFTLSLLVYLSSFLAIDSLKTVFADGVSLDISGYSTESLDLILPANSGATDSIGTDIDQSNPSVLNSQNQNFVLSTSTQNQPPVSWKDFQDRNGLFTAEYPSNWIPSARQEYESPGPIDFIVNYQDPENRFAMLNIFQPSGISLFTTPKDVVDNSIASDLSAQGITLQRQAECDNMKLNGLPACDYVILSSGPDSTTLKIMQVSTVDPSGTEYHAQYLTTPDLFDFFYPTVKYMIESFKTMPVNENSTR